MKPTELSAAGAAATTPVFPLTALAVTTAIQTFVSVAMAVPSVVAPKASLDLGLPAQNVGWLISVTYLAAMFAGLYGGGVSQRVGAVRISQWALLASAVSLVLFALGWAPALLTAAAMLGVGYGLTNPSAAEVLSRHSPPLRRGLFFSIKQTGVPLGVAVAGAIVPWLLGLAGWRAAVLMLSAPLAVLAVAVAPSRGRLEHASRGAVPGPRRNPFELIRRRLLLPMRDVFAFAPTRRLSITSLVYAFTQVCFLSFLVLLLTVEHGLSLPAAAALLSVSQLASVAGRIGWGHVSDHWIDPTRLLGLLGVAMAIGIFALGLAPHGTPWPVLAGVVLLCASTAVAWNGVYFADLVRSVPPTRVAESTGAMQFMTFTGGMSGSALFATLVGVLGGYGRVFALLALLPALAGVVLLRAASSRAR